jgi:hypothetical protein
MVSNITVSLSLGFNQDLLPSVLVNHLPGFASQFAELDRFILQIDPSSNFRTGAAVAQAR